RKVLPKQFPISRRVVQMRQYRLANRLITRTSRVRRRHGKRKSVIELIELGSDGPRRASKTGDFHEFRRRQLSLRGEQRLDDRIVAWETRNAFRRRENETTGVVEGIARRAEKPAVPHQFRIERSIHHARRSALVPGA